MAKKRYTIEIEFTGRYQTEIKASSEEEARQAAETELRLECQWCVGVDSIDAIEDEECEGEWEDEE